MARHFSYQPPKTGDSFAMWKIVDPEITNHKILCRCICGIEKPINIYNLMNGKSTSCGCSSRRRAEKHGLSKSPEYQIWKAVKARCYNILHKNYSDYGGRGIVMCDRWLHSPELFISDMGPRPSPKHSIERNDTNSNYSPENCRWATQQEQMRNTRRSSKITYKGEEKTIAEWAVITGIGDSTLHHRINAGWSVERSIETPARKMQK